jgi:PAS domain S-box-containing protein
MAETQPTLEDLREVATAAWLWDSARGRLVWANKAAVKAFDATSLFDLIDRPFDAREVGVARIREIALTLQRGQAEKALLHFPSTGAVLPFSVTCWMHALADGRLGVLVVQEPEKPKLSLTPDAVAADVVASLPLPVLVLDAAGRFLHGNEAAQKLLADMDATGLTGFLGSEERAQRLLARLEASALTTSTEHVGGRDYKCVFTRSATTTTLLLEDVTERRALEQDMLASQIAALDAKVAAAAPVVVEMPPAASPAAVFENLGKSIEEAVKAQTPVAAEAKPEPEIDTPAPRKVPYVPAAVRLSLERTGKAILVARDGDALFATTHAARLLGHEDVQALFANDPLWAELYDSSSGAALSLVMADGTQAAFACTRARVPWLNGPADQFLLDEMLAEERQAARESKPAHMVLRVVERNTPVETPPVIPDLVPQVDIDPPTEEIMEAVPELLEPASEIAETAPPAIAYEELKAILDVASDGIITLNEDGVILSFSAGAEAIFGLTQAEVLERPLMSLVKTESRKVLRDYLAGLSGPGLGSVFNDGREVVAATKEGNSVPLFITVSRLHSAQSRAALCAVVRDITSWKRTERELREAKEQAETANRQKSDFLARISHELRTPLNAIMGFSEVMRMERFGAIKNDKYRAYANDIHDSGEHLLALINDLLDLSKVEAGKLELNFTAESVADATEHAVKLLQEEARMARVLIRTSFPPKLPRVVADHRALRQIVLNLLSNAVKYTNAGGQVAVSGLIESDGSLVLRVKDTGIGMTEAQLQDALQPFTRVETPDRARQGTGLGLPLTKALTEANRAKLRMTSAPNHGTMAEIVFPGTRVLAE